MAIFKPQDSDYVKAHLEGKPRRLLSAAAFAKFNPSLLGLGDLALPSSATDAIAGIFDLGGFTNFCKQIEPHLSVPLFLSEFLDWLMQRLKSQSKKKQTESGVWLLNPLPFFVKFMGDGLLVLWDVSKIGDPARRNVIRFAYEICQSYKTDFLPDVACKVVDPPTLLRCGLARGTVYSVGDGSDYVGSCINMAARLQKLPGVPFAFNRRGINLEATSRHEFFKKRIVVRRVSVRGIGENELVAIEKAVFDAMTREDKAQFRPLR
jgi:hypothetical protein